MIRIILTVAALVAPQQALAAIEYDMTLPDGISWGVCFTLLMYIMAYRFTVGPAALISAIALGYWGYKSWEILQGKPTMLSPDAYNAQIATILLMTLFAFAGFLSFSKRRK